MHRWHLVLFAAAALSILSWSASPRRADAQQADPNVATVDSTLEAGRHLSTCQRVEFVYGYGKLDRFGLNGATQFYQVRLLAML